MSNTSISLKPINDLLRESFLIAAYQRGYRWTEQQVTELLDDIHAFAFSALGPNSFYCLQPVVVQATQADTKWEVVDGQQRLTTIFLILQFFNSRLMPEHRKNLYTIDYETRSGSTTYLAEPTEEKSEENIDFHFIYRAKQTIDQWFKGKENLVNDLEATLLNRVKVIWYQLAETENPIDAFTRLNVGKIPLTNAELIRGLFLRSKNFPQSTASLQQLKIAQEWDAMEKALQNDDFWCFLTDRLDQPNRIELIFKLIIESKSADSQHHRPSSDVFHSFNDLLAQEATTPDLLWDEVKQCFMTLEEWYRDAKLFHLIGYLVNEGERLVVLIKLSQTAGKHAFRIALKRLMLKKLLPDYDAAASDPKALEENLRELCSEVEYSPGSSKIKSLLLLFNIASIIANDKSIVRFRFDYFKKESWDIEHIRSVESGRPQANIDKRPWLETVRDYFDETGGNPILRDRAAELLTSQAYTTGDAFDLLYDEVIMHFDEHESTEAENGLGNLALLDSGTNRGYKNAVFPIKRRRLLQRDQEGTFVPLCTRNAFLKCYSEKVENMFFWGTADQADYLAAIVSTLARFFRS